MDRVIWFVLAAFLASYTVVPWAHRRWLFWRMDRDYARACKRFEGCRHVSTCRVNVGGVSPIYVRKCRRCWALEVFDAYEGGVSTRARWTPNSAPPPPESSPGD